MAEDHPEFHAIVCNLLISHHTSLIDGESSSRMLDVSSLPSHHIGFLVHTQPAILPRSLIFQLFFPPKWRISQHLRLLVSLSISFPFFCSCSLVPSFTLDKYHDTGEALEETTNGQLVQMVFRQHGHWHRVHPPTQPSVQRRLATLHLCDYILSQRRALRAASYLLNPTIYLVAQHLLADAAATHSILISRHLSNGPGYHHQHGRICLRTGLGQTICALGKLPHPRE